MEKPDLQPDHTGTVTIVRWLRHGDPLPKGWRLADQRLDTHHAAHAVLIVEDPPSGDPA